MIADSNFIQPTGAWFDVFRSYPFDVFNGYAVKGGITDSYMRVLNSALDFDAPICPTIYLENHDHATITYELGSRDRWYKAQPYMIALATCSGTVLLHNGQEWGQLEDLWEDDSNAPPEFKRVQSRPLTWEQRGRRYRPEPDQPVQLSDGPARGASSLALSLISIPITTTLPGRGSRPMATGSTKSLQVAIYHRWAGGDLYMIVLNFSDSVQYVNVPLPQNGVWTDLLNSNGSLNVQNYALYNFAVSSNWGAILQRSTG